MGVYHIIQIIIHRIHTNAVIQTITIPHHMDIDLTTTIIGIITIEMTSLLQTS